MPTRRLSVFSGTPMGDDTLVDEVDLFLGNAIASTFDLIKHTGLNQASEIQVDGEQYLRFNDGYSLTGNQITLPFVPINNAIILAPGSNNLLVPLYDQDPIPGIDDPRVKEIAFWVGNVSDIQFYKYVKPLALDGITISAKNLIPGYGASVDWFQFAPALADGTVGSYSDPGEAITTADISAVDLIDGALTGGGTTVTVPDGSLFTAGDNVVLDFQEDNRETVKIVSILGDVLTTSGYIQNHDDEATLHTCGRKFYMKVTIPLDAVNNDPTNLYNCTVNLKYDFVSR